MALCAAKGPMPCLGLIAAKSHRHVLGSTAPSLPGSLRLPARTIPHIICSPVHQTARNLKSTYCQALPFGQGRPNLAATVRTQAAAAANPSPPAPVEGLFWKKVACLGMIFLGATVNYTILQSVRDGIIVTSCGAEALPIISAFGVLPASLAFFMYYDKIVKTVTPQAVFYWAMAPLVAFYALFAAVLLPNVGVLHPVDQVATWTAALPDSLSCFVKVAANWTYTLFFIMAELWGSVAISMLFWSLADDVCTLDEAKDVYPKLGILANFGLIAAGAFTRFVNEFVAKGNEVLALQVMVASICAMSAMMAGVKSFLDTNITPHLAQRGKKKKKKTSSKAEGKQDTWAILRESSKIRNLTMLVMGYGITHKLFGFVWKGQMRLLYPSAAEYTMVMGDVASVTGITTIALMLGSKFVFQNLGWRGAALLTPVVMTVAGAVFLAAAVLNPAATPAAGTLAAILLGLGPVAGIVVQVAGRAAKYSLFDPSKEMVFITMDSREKEAGKAAVDLLGNQVGKSGGSWVMQGALLVFGSMAAALPFTAVFYMAVCLLWLQATAGLASFMEQENEEKMVAQSIDEMPQLQPLGAATPLPATSSPNILVSPSLSAAFAGAGGSGVAGFAGGSSTAVGVVVEPTSLSPAQPEVNAGEAAKADQEAKASMQSHFD